MKKIKVEGHQNLARDPISGAVLNINRNEIQNAKLAKQKRKEKDRKIEELEKSLNDVRSMLEKLLEKH